MKKSLLTVFLILFLATCSTNNSAPETPAAEVPTFTLAPTEMSSAFESFPTQPTPTRYLTSTPTQTPMPTHTPAPTNTKTPAVTQVGDFVSLSPSREWAVWRVNCGVFEVYGCLKFTKEDAQYWTFTEEAFDLWKGTEYAVQVEFAFWAEEEDTVYITLAPMDLEISFYPVVGIMKLSLVDGSTSYVVKPAKTANGDPLQAYAFYRYGFSDNGQWLAYLWKTDKSLEVRLVNLHNGVVKESSVDVALQYALFGDVSWSPNNQSFVFSVSESDLYSDFSDDFSVFLFTVRDESIEPLYAHGDLSLYDPEWISVSEVMYKYLDLEAHSGEAVLDIKTGEMTILN